MTVFKQLLNDYKQCLLRGDHSDGAAAYLALVDEYEQAARRAPAVPVPQGWKLVPVEATDDMEVAAENEYEQKPSYFPDWKSAYSAMLAAVPQPPEAAPVELPEPVYTMRVRGRMHDYTPTLSAFDLADGEHKLYTEQQVRQLLADNGIGKDKA